MKSTSIYFEVMSALKQISQVKDSDLGKFIMDTSYVNAALIDDAIFFNLDSSKCLSLNLQKTSNFTKTDQVVILRGTKKILGGNFPKTDYLMFLQ